MAGMVLDAALPAGLDIVEVMDADDHPGLGLPDQLKAAVWRIELPGVGIVDRVSCRRSPRSSRRRPGGPGSPEVDHGVLTPRGGECGWPSWTPGCVVRSVTVGVRYWTLLQADLPFDPMTSCPACGLADLEPSDGASRDPPCPRDAHRRG